MKAREKPSMKTVIGLIEKFGQMDMEQLGKSLPMSPTAIYKSCKNAIDEGYLQVNREKKEGVCGRRHCVYVRTDKPYSPPRYSDKTLKNREYLKRQMNMDRIVSESVAPFRHWMDSALFGTCPPLDKPQIGTGRIYRQSMSTCDDELEAA